MPRSMRSVPFDALLVGEILIGALLLGPAPAARAGDDGKVQARDLMKLADDESKRRSKLFFGDQDSPDPVLLRDASDAGDHSEKARRVVAEEVLDHLEDELNEGKWIPWHRATRKDAGPSILFGLDDPAPAPAVATDSWRNRFRLSLVRGLEYRQQWTTLHSGKFEMRIFGPIVQGGPGLGLQLEGRALDRRFRLNAYGLTDEVGLTVAVEF